MVTVAWREMCAVAQYARGQALVDGRGGWWTCEKRQRRQAQTVAGVTHVLPRGRRGEERRGGWGGGGGGSDH